VSGSLADLQVVDDTDAPAAAPAATPDAAPTPAAPVAPM